MPIEDRLRNTSALDRSVREVDAVQRLEQLKGRQRRRARMAVVSRRRSCSWRWAPWR